MTMIAAYAQRSCICTTHTCTLYMHASVATLNDLTWANKTASFDLKDNKATEINMDGINE